MRKWCVVLITLFLVTIDFIGQNPKQFHFKIDGTINADTGTVYLQFYSAYIPNNTKGLAARVRNNKFSISGYIPEPQAVFILLDDRFRTSDFIIEKGVQTISINTASTQEVPNVLNHTMINEYPDYTAFFKQLNSKRNVYYQKRDSLEKLYNYSLPKTIKLNLTKEDDDLYDEGNKLLLTYSKKNPTSKIAFWKLIQRMSWGYEPVFDSIYNSFSHELKNGYAGRVLYKKLENGRLLSIGGLFPSLQCVSQKNEKFSTAVFLKRKFTLVDFWFSSCGPCRAQFKHLKDIYNQFSNKGFEIVGISVDKGAHKKDWENAILHDKLLWQQYWDMNGKEAHKFAINVFPSNFLIDSTGKIIAKNISVEELEVLLTRNLK